MTRRRVNNFDPAGFARFWEDYPRHQGKLDAYKAWCQVHPTVETQQQIHVALGWQKNERGWRQNILYVPLPASYLRGERWMDEPMTKTTAREPGESWCRHEPKCASPIWHKCVIAKERGEI